MRKLFLLCLTVMLMTACQQEQRYFADSTEIETLKTAITAYESGDWETWRSHFADTAKVYANSTEGISVSERQNSLNELTSVMSSYGFDKTDDHIEMVVDKKDETWVYYWATHKGTLKNGKELTIPVHLAVRFDGGKIVAEHIYFDATELNNEIAAMMAAQEASEAETEEAEMTED